jgi:hypothetical protein
MQSPKRPGRVARSRQQPVIEPAPEGVEDSDAEFDSDDTFDTYRVICPDCAQSIALLADEDVLPEHALCPSPWDPFGLQVCAGTGRASADARPADGSGEDGGQEAALLLTLPQSLDWRTQPFSHVGGPGSRPIPVPQMRRPAA